MPWRTKLVWPALVAVLTAAGCSDERPQARPVPMASSTATSLTASPSPSPSLTPMPISAFEADPAVAGLRAYLAAVAQAVNSKNLQLPALLATSLDRLARGHAL